MPNEGSAGANKAVVTRATRGKCKVDGYGTAMGWRRWAARARGGRARDGRACGRIVEDDGGDDRQPPGARPRRRARRAHRLLQLVCLSTRCAEWGVVNRARSRARGVGRRWWEWPQ